MSGDVAPRNVGRDGHPGVNTCPIDGIGPALDSSAAQENQGQALPASCPVVARTPRSTPRRTWRSSARVAAVSK
jgi:hypothetical protein